MGSGSTYLVLAEIPPEGVDDFAEYERNVLPLLSEHGGRLERRVRTPTGALEVHLVEFPSPKALEEFRADPRRSQHAWLLERSGARVQLEAVVDVPPHSHS